MKTIGLIGGITWLSTVEYYKLLNQMVNVRLGGVASAKIILCSVNFEEIKTLTVADDWDGIAALILDAAQKLEKAGADCVLLGANTMHKIADQIQAGINIPLIHIAEKTATAIVKSHLTTVALLGTKYTMQLDFYKDKLSAQGVNTIIPNINDIDLINQAIYNEMGKGIFLAETKNKFISIIEKLARKGAEGVIFGCTEIPLLLKQDDVTIPVFDTTFIHAEAAISFALT